MSDILEVTISHLATQGDGAARLPDGHTVFVADTLPQERVTIRLTSGGRGQLVDILTPSPHRTTPPCPLFERCGGCTLQYMDLPALLEWKTGLVAHALEKAGFEVPTTIQSYQVPLHSRRRADLAVRRTEQGIVIGLHAKGSQDVTDMTSCAVLHPTIVASLPALRATLRSLRAVHKAADLHINLLDSGLDILLSTDSPLIATDRQRLTALAEELDIPRISWQRMKTTGQSETAVQRAPVFQTIAGHQLTPPPGAFLQATPQSESAIQNAVLEALPARLGKRATVIELYAGCGTLSLPLGERCQVQAYEGYEPALTALKSVGKSRITSICRDLNRQPVMGKDLGKAEVVVLDPPHAGAKLQMRQIALGKPDYVIYVSCNPVALSNDTSLLASAGYRLETVSVIDQFLWSAETEAVCCFKRESSRRSRNALSHWG
ncbi:23S rRNA (uracil(1939)-C(5))-methyltransferase RlmD [Acetobacter ghanensis]|uniref:23S rRNA (Uracil(1939)-C(5))-methyltransferase RlmD n=1 Tax=Acetobacter ghanensis TaxID=431306 RepID=A0A0U5F560_9PROT|nr:23S rRNA (uracil(1939)-C(5))-methyltransferase RlmD [Acetobacter ghanensis]NHO39242.1 23S rRNA (uracil(1939)-C(5))-methyltransferase RlmD [Acetobacter ghanensis]GBQ45390.1 ribosomal large subunit 23S rRNA methyltransferase [Acetobacter ghanensis DSM 18895]CEF56568.1 RNA methyltransferase, TrmA family [Acetobacter ghanensis]